MGGGGRVEPPTKFLKPGLDWTFFFRRGLVGKRGDLFDGDGTFYKKNKLNYEIFNGNSNCIRIWLLQLRI